MDTQDKLITAILIIILSLFVYLLLSYLSYSKEESVTPGITYTAEDGEYCFEYIDEHTTFKTCSTDKEKIDALFDKFTIELNDIEEAEKY